MISLKLFIMVFLVVHTCGHFAHAQGETLETLQVDTSPTLLHGDSLLFLEHPQPLPNWYDFVGNLPHDIGSFAVLSVSTRTLPTIVGLTALTLGLVVTDQQTYTFTSGFYERSKTVASVSDFLVSLGDGKSPLMLAGAFGLYGFVASDHRSLRVASQTVEALLVTGLVVQTLKHVAGRESPSEATSEGGTWRPFPSFKAYNHHQSRYHAFPSGHITTTMATVTILVENYPEQGWLKPVGYSVVGLVGIGLVNNGWHWYSDFPLGIALGYAFGKIVAHPEGETPANNPGEVEMSFAPIMNEYGSGMRFSLRF
jgi:hypothetical protein